MNIDKQIRHIYNLLEEAMSYEDWSMVEDTHEEISVLIRDMDSDFLIDSDDY